MDFTIRDCLIFDGTGAEPVRGDVAVRGDAIAAVGRVTATAPVIIDAEGRALAPGFIDAHGHTDDVALIIPLLDSKLLQGVTTEFCGQCGVSPAPLTSDIAARTEKRLGPGNTPLPWRTLAGFFDLLEERGIGVNLASQVGQGNLRGVVVGYENRPATEEEQARMAELAAQALREGAHGVSTGLIYVPSSYADTDELIAICRPLANLGGVYTTHMRDEGDRLLEAVAETIAIGRGAGVPVHIAHHKAIHKRNWGKVKGSLALLDAARAEGIAVTADVYPYLATATGLSASLPDWAREGGREAIRAHLADPATRARMVADLPAREADIWDARHLVGFSVEKNQPEEGRSVREIAAARGQAPAEAMVDLLHEEGGDIGQITFGMCEEDVETVLRHPMVMIGSDAEARTLSGPLATGKPHPRAFGTFPRVLGRYVRERGVLTLPEAIRRMTSLPAATFGFRDRGLLQAGKKADLVLFDPATIADRATFVDPRQPPEGIDSVWVNGVLAVEHGKITGRRGGRVLRRS
jgi:N-acyl-D-amino-acid deacylase